MKGVERHRSRLPSNPALKYGRVYFVLRRELRLSALECLLLDMLETLSRRTGWCFASRQYLAGLLGVSVRSVQRMLDRLKSRELIEVDPTDSVRVRPAPAWRSAKRRLHL
jgi:DNA-binding MarR family transcriptional regulator